MGCEADKILIERSAAGMPIGGAPLVAHSSCVALIGTFANYSCATHLLVSGCHSFALQRCGTIPVRRPLRSTGCGDER